MIPANPRAPLALALLALAAAPLAGCRCCEEPVDSSVRAAGPEAARVATADAGAYARPGFVTALRDGRLWVFRADGAAAREFERAGPPAEHVTFPGAGPDGLTLRAAERDEALEYLATRGPFRARCHDGRVWVGREGSEALAAVAAGAEPADSASWPGAGPLAATVRAEDADTLLAWAACRPGFATFVHDGRVWVFHEGSDALEAYRRAGPPAECVTRVGAGPRGSTLRAADGATLDAYAQAR